MVIYKYNLILWRYFDELRIDLLKLLGVNFIVSKISFNLVYIVLIIE